MKIFILSVMLLSALLVPATTPLRGILETEKGTIVIEMYADVAPRTVARMAELANAGFFDGIVFHRVVENFVIQAGDPLGTGEGGSGISIPAEFSHLHYLRGSVGMARSDDINSNDSQFFICLSDQPHLDSKYTLFGQVVSGTEVIDLIVQGDRIVSFRIREE
jgi:cyclophilin family peptidyl-prolyl cis-trans isomerase